MTYIASYESSLGPITLAITGESLIGLWFDGQKYDRLYLHGPLCAIDQADNAEVAIPHQVMEIIAQTRLWLDSYFKGVAPSFTPPLHIEGSEFKQLVTEAMLAIPFGETCTYGDIARWVARRLGRDTMSAQAVGGAVGHNPISLIVPCHRVIGSSGSLTGYAGGLDRKAWLLRHEACFSGLFTNL